MEQTKRISFRISSVLSKVEVEVEPDFHTGSNGFRLLNTADIGSCYFALVGTVSNLAVLVVLPTNTVEISMVGHTSANSAKFELD